MQQKKQTTNYSFLNIKINNLFLNIFSKKFSKKAISSIIVVLVFFLVLLVVFLVFLNNFNDVSQKKAYSEACNKYITMHIFGRKGIVDFNLDDFPCKTEKITIKGNSKYEIMKEISEKMVRCSNSYHNGREDMFQGTSSDFTTFCSFCYKLDFENKNQEISMFDLFLYQSTHKIKGEKYSDILSNKQFSEEFVKQLKNIETKIDKAELEKIRINTSKEYLIVFKMRKKEAMSLTERILAGAAIGAATGFTAVTVGAFTVLSGGTALFLLAPAVTAGGVAGGYIGYEVSRISKNGREIYSGTNIVEFNPENIKELNCSVVIGIQEPGITRRE